ncbi:MAG TPA: helix-turn-helix domain-containing protein [Jatrophihabitans sp.]|nr:helix-turn-helix domain-containing protein [Jatrophihabitans sp.]
MKPLRRDAAENRERLLAAANQVFADHGLDAGVEEVAQAAGVGMGTLYRRFPSKQALIDALVGNLRLELLELARSAGEREDGSGLRWLLFAAGELQAAQPACLQRLWRHSDVEPEAVTEIRQAFADLLADAQRHGTVRPDVTSTDITLVIWSIVGIIDTTGAVAPTAWRRHLELLLAGLRPSGQPAAGLTEPALSPAAAAAITG